MRLHCAFAIAALAVVPVVVSALSAQDPPKVSPYLAPPDVAAPPADAEKTATGVAFKVIKAGTETIHPKPADTVTVHYSGWTTDGKMFDSSIKRGKPAAFALNRVIPGWTEGVAADGRGREAPALDPRGAGLQGPAGRAQRHARVRRRAARDRRQRPSRRRCPQT